PGQTRGDLVRVSGKSREIVDSYVWSWRYYGDDCVGYRRMVVGGSEVLFVCGDRQPLLLTHEGSSDAWSLADTGPEDIVKRTVRDGLPVTLGVRFGLVELKKVSARLPRRRQASSRDNVADVSMADGVIARQEFVTNV